MASAGQQIRIAIALAALRHKPPEQSVQAYILDLQAAFPSATDRECRRAPSPNPWRDRVLALEKDLNELQAQYDNEKLGEFSLDTHLRVMSIKKHGQRMQIPSSGSCFVSTPSRVS
ncbi:hypothetical protein C8Q80DRAFT_1092347 [Daedaleopsis nitida]|nr:hypothetical protein C8Q80DRAFT_1092347 [Daedaleopsis nitida]